MNPIKRPTEHPPRGRGRMTDRFSSTSKPKDTKQVIKRLWTYFGQEKRKLFFLISAVLIQVMSTLTVPKLIGLWVDTVDESLKAGEWIKDFNLIYFLGIVYSLSALAIYIQGRVVARLSQKVMFKMRQSLMHKLTLLPIEYYDKHSHGDMMSRFTNDVENVSATISEALSELVSSSLIMTGALVMMFFLSWKLTLVILILVPFIFLISKVIAKVSRPLFKERANSLGRLSGIVEESISGLSVVQAFNQEDQMVEDFETANQSYLKYGLKAQITVGYLMPLVHVIYNLSFALIAFTGGYMVLNDMISIGIVMSFIAYSKQFLRPVNLIAAIYSTLQSALASSERLFEFLDEENEQTYGEFSLKDLKNTNVSFENIEFSYDEDHTVISNISFKVESGKKIALVGPTGAGKTTLVNLLARFYQPGEGVIKLGNVNINTFDQYDFYKAFGIVLQDPYLFNGSIRDNIIFGQENISEEILRDALEASMAHHFVDKLPQGLETIITEGGNSISQGQKQLLTIARAILANPKILILDEATSNVDTRTEKQIQSAMLELMNGRTSFIIAHRLSTIRDADHILVIEDGEIVESGNHESLMRDKNRYYTMIKHQYNNEAIEESS